MPMHTTSSTSVINLRLAALPTACMTGPKRGTGTPNVKHRFPHFECLTMTLQTGQNEIAQTKKRALHSNGKLNKNKGNTQIRSPAQGVVPCSNIDVYIGQAASHRGDAVGNGVGWERYNHANAKMLVRRCTCAQHVKLKVKQKRPKLPKSNRSVYGKH